MTCMTFWRSVGFMVCLRRKQSFGYKQSGAGGTCSPPAMPETPPGTLYPELNPKWPHKGGGSKLLVRSGKRSNLTGSGKGVKWF